MRGNVSRNVSLGAVRLSRFVAVSVFDLLLFLFLGSQFLGIVS